MKILVVTSKLPWPATGADECDRAYGVGLLKEMGYEVFVIAKIASYQKKNHIQEFSDTFSVPTETVPYTRGGFSLGKLTNPLWLDGAAYEYTDPAFQKIVLDKCIKTKPTLVWLDCSFSWPLIRPIQKLGIPVVSRPVTVESHNLLEEGLGGINGLKFFAKDIGERILASRANALFPISPNEAEFYKNRGANHVAVLPLRQLPEVIKKQTQYRDTNALQIIFTGSTYNVQHNLQAVEFVIKKIAPLLYRTLPSAVIHITGAKLPAIYEKNMPANVRYEGYIEDLDSFFENIDIALPIYLRGAGMQAKIFEPLARGVPTITMAQGMQGYPFNPHEEFLSVQTPEDAVKAIMQLRPRIERERVGRAARSKALLLFSQEKLKKTIQDTFSKILLQY